MNVKAIMCDIDGTLLSSDGVVAPKTVEMIKKAREQRILFGLSTGRDVNSIQTLLKSWGIDGLVDMIVGTGGAEIYGYTLDLEKAQYPLDGRLIKSIIKHYEDMVTLQFLKMGFYLCLKMMNIFKCYQRQLKFLIKWLIMMNSYKIQNLN